MDTSPQWSRDFLASRELTCLPTSQATYRQCICAFERWLDGRSISAPLISAYLAEMKATRALETARNHRRMLKTCCHWLFAQGLIDHDPFVGPGKVASIPRKRVRRMTYTDGDVVRLLQASGPIAWKQQRRTERSQWKPGGPLAREAAQQHALILLLIDSAMRAGEVAGLACRQIRAEELVVLGKGGHEDVVFIESETRTALLGLCADRADDAPVFRDWNGHPATPRSLRTMLRRLARRAGVELLPRPLHAFRHYAARQWQRAKVPDLTIQQYMRHADIRTTQLYTGLSTKELQELHTQVSPVQRLLRAAEGSEKHQSTS